MYTLRTLIPLLLIASICRAQTAIQPPDSAWARTVLASMSLEQKVGQIFVPSHTDTNRTTEWITRYHIGGIWFARTEAHHIADEINRLQAKASIPLLVSVDFEKGAGTYVDGATDLPSQMALGATRDPAIVERAAALTAREARAIGVRINYAPVLDVNNNPKNPIINTRSYGEDPALVAKLGIAAIRGYQGGGILATGKHFPGHGNTSTDTHASIGIVTGDQAELDSVELRPYREVLAATQLSSIMSAHLWIKAIDTDTLPATLSRGVMTGLLRGKLGFTGLVFTDAMVMGGIAGRYRYEDAVVRAIEAGCDIILFPGSVERGTQAIIDAVRSGRLPEERVSEAAFHMLLAKSRAGLESWTPIDTGRISTEVGTAANYEEAKEIAAKCLTLARDDRHLVPLPVTARTAVFTLSNKEGNSIQSRGLISFPGTMAEINPSTTTMALSDTMTEVELADAAELARRSDIVVIAAYVKIVLSSGTVELPEESKSILRRLADANPRIVLVSFGNPYIGGSLPEVPTYVCAYDNARALQETAAEALYGKRPFTGKLPVTISGTMPFGAGIVTK